MTPQESIISELGNITFRIETNLFTLSRYMSTDKDCQPLMDKLFTDLFNDVEKLKYLKQKLENWDWPQGEPLLVVTQPKYDGIRTTTLPVGLS